MRLKAHRGASTSATSASRRLSSQHAAAASSVIAEEDSPHGRCAAQKSSESGVSASTKHCVGQL